MKIDARNEVSRILVAVVIAILTVLASRNADAGVDFELIAAAHDGDNKRVVEMLTKGADINAQHYGSGPTALMWAVRKKHYETVKLLLEKGADPDVQDEHGESALIYAIHGNDESMIKLLLTAAENINVRLRGGRTPLMFAVSTVALRVNISTIKLLLDYGADVNAMADNGDTAMSEARGAQGSEVRKLLAERGAKNPPITERYANKELELMGNSDAGKQLRNSLDSFGLFPGNLYHWGALVCRALKDGKNEAEVIKSMEGRFGSTQTRIKVSVAKEVICPPEVNEGLAAITSQDYDKALRLLEPRAVEGHAAAQNGMAVLYLNGWGVGQDYTAARIWLSKGAEQQDPRAQYNLGRMYDEGGGVRKDYLEAVKWYRKSAEQGYPVGQSILGSMYALGHGVAQNYRKAMRWYRKAADQGEPEAQRRVGFMYAEGQGVRNNYIEAGKWFRKAAEQGHGGGRYWLGKLYYEGWGVQKNLAEAAKWYEMAAEQGVPEAQYSLGVMYAEGKGIEKNRDKALVLLRKAADQDNKDAQMFLKQRLR